MRVGSAVLLAGCCTVGGRGLHLILISGVDVSVSFVVALSLRLENLSRSLQAGHRLAANAVLHVPAHLVSTPNMRKVPWTLNLETQVMLMCRGRVLY